MHVPELRGPGLLACLLLTLLTGCVVPVQSAPGLSGAVVDATTGRPVSDAIVVVRFDGRYGDQLPDRDLLGHAETLTAADGSFQFERFSRGGLSVWPLFRSEARVVAVLSAGYRCPEPRHVTGVEDVQIALEPALDLEDQQASCRPVASSRGQTERFHAAWRELYPAPESPAARDERRQLARALEARSALGFGENCDGPVQDLALAPDGGRLALAVTTGAGSVLKLVEVADNAARALQSIGRADDVPPRRLAWSRPGELVLWSPARLAGHTGAASVFGAGEAEVVWSNSPALPAAIDGSGEAAREKTPLEPDQLSDEADTRWNGRSFSMEPALDLDTGLARDRLLVLREDGSRYVAELPGEACGGPRFGRPQYRIGAGGHHAFDLRFVDGGCHAVAIDLETGAWSTIDGSAAQAQCRSERSLPPAQLMTALRGWTRELHDAMREQGIDTRFAYALRISKTGATQVLGRDAGGRSVTGSAPRFPLVTPLRRIDVTNISPHSAGRRATPSDAPARLAPL